jgi:hypothetical protein
MSSKQVILNKSEVVNLFSKLETDHKFNNMDEYINHMKNVHGLSPYKKDIRKCSYTFYGLGEGDNKMNHYSIKKEGFFTERYRYYIVNKQKWFLTKINYGL